MREQHLVVRAQELRDPEVEELRFTFRRNEDGRRLEIAVDDEVLVRVGDSRADLAEQLEPLANGELMRVAVPADRLAFHILEDEEREPVIGCPAVDQAREVGLGELRENLPFVSEAAQESQAVAPAGEDFWPHFAAIRALG